ncbi:MAG TPA: hypothetical protein VKZ52_03060 [Burkholderiaceae bacterium]|nr:hypothetical protein [Burkholderiaceae bacterium]
MNTHDMIELPPLPNINVGGKDYKQVWFSAGEVDELRRAAIEADRKRRGEPVAWIQRSYLNLIRESNVALHNVVVRGSRLDGDGDVVPLYTAPQPAEPESCFCDRMYPDSNPDASCGDCPIRDYGAKAAERVKDDDEGDMLTVAYMSGYHEGKKAAQAEPVKVPSDAEILDELQAHGALATSNAVCAVRALLDRYGKGAP